MKNEGEVGPAARSGVDLVAHGDEFTVAGDGFGFGGVGMGFSSG
ncbi:MAG: hypothetical protein R3F21_09015 [Myxococcota bacterium]